MSPRGAQGVGLRAQLIMFRDNGGKCVCAETQRFVFDVSKHGLGFGRGLTNETQEKGSKRATQDLKVSAKAVSPAGTFILFQILSDCTPDGLELYQYIGLISFVVAARLSGGRAYPAARHYPTVHREIGDGGLHSLTFQLNLSRV